MSIKQILSILLFIFCSTNVMAQADFYYYNGNKIPITLNENKVCISIPKESSTVSDRIRTDVQVLSTISDDLFDIIIITHSDYENLTNKDYWRDDASFVILSSVYKTESGEEVASTPYLNVKLKNDNDTEILNTYVQNYKLKNIRSSSLTSWYILAVTSESEKSSLACANELYESGVFASSIPDLASFSGNMTTVRFVSTPTSAESTEYYDLLGHRIDTPSGLTIVVTRYNDGSMRTEKKLF